MPKKDSIIKAYKSNLNTQYLGKRETNETYSWSLLLIEYDIYILYPEAGRGAQIASFWGANHASNEDYSFIEVYLEE